MSIQNSKKQILKSSSIIGGASIITIIIGLIKVKVLALLLGPTGVGLMGIFLSLLGLGTTFFGLGLATIGVREISINHSIPEKVDQVRKSLLLANVILGSFALILVTLNRKVLSNWLFDSIEYQWAVFFVGIAIFISLIGNAQSAVLQGFRKINEQAKIKIIGTMLSTIVGLVFIWWLGEKGITGFVISVPVFSCILGVYYTRQLPKISSVKLSWTQLRTIWKSMAILGFFYMLSGFMGEGTKLLVREILHQELDLKSVGYFQAAWAISMTYIGFVLGAMATDYYPRLTAVIHDKLKVNELINQQTEIALIFSAPILFGMLTFSPVVIHLLYSSEFTPAIGILRWQVIGDVLKIIAWPLGFILLSMGKGKLFFSLEFIWNMCYLMMVYFGVNKLGLEITGYAFTISYLIYLAMTYIVIIRISYARWSTYVKKIILFIVVISVTILILTYVDFWLSILFGTISVIVSVLVMLKTLKEIRSKV